MPMIDADIGSRSTKKTTARMWERLLHAGTVKMVSAAMVLCEASDISIFRSESIGSLGSAHQ
jgi:hypothetical protein